MILGNNWNTRILCVLVLSFIRKKHQVKAGSRTSWAHTRQTPPGNLVALCCKSHSSTPGGVVFLPFQLTVHPPSWLLTKRHTCDAHSRPLENADLLRIKSDICHSACVSLNHLSYVKLCSRFFFFLIRVYLFWCVTEKCSECCSYSLISPWASWC